MLKRGSLSLPFYVILCEKHFCRHIYLWRWFWQESGEKEIRENAFFLIVLFCSASAIERLLNKNHISFSLKRYEKMVMYSDFSYDISFESPDLLEIVGAPQFQGLHCTVEVFWKFEFWSHRAYIWFDVAKIENSNIGFDIVKNIIRVRLWYSYELSVILKLSLIPR